MEIIYSDIAKKHLEWWRSTGNVKARKKIAELLEELKINPLTGTGEPEALKHGLSGTYSRRITGEHRMVYEVAETTVMILSLKGHYE